MKKLIATICAIIVCFSAQSQNFCIAEKGRTAPIVVDDKDWTGVIRAARDLGDDVTQSLRNGIGSDSHLQFSP